MIVGGTLDAEVVHNDVFFVCCDDFAEYAGVQVRASLVDEATRPNWLDDLFLLTSSAVPALASATSASTFALLSGEIKLGDSAEEGEDSNSVIDHVVAADGVILSYYVTNHVRIHRGG